MPAQRVFSDQPIQGFSEDLLSRKPFVGALLQAVQSAPQDESFVIAVHGMWGEGKTSVINLLIPNLLQAGYKVVNFNPWEWSSRADLSEVFLDELTVGLGGQSRRQNKEIAKALRRYGARLKGGLSIATVYAPYIRAAVGTSLLASIFAGVFGSRTTWLISLLALTVTLLSTALPSIAEIINPSDKELEPSLQFLKLDVISKILAAKTKVVVVVDDLDRLQPEEASEMIRLVKANGDLPNICYLLVGDIEILATHLKSVLKVPGRAYLGKVIQMSLSLPKIQRNRLDRVFFEGVDKLIRDEQVTKLWNRKRWNEVFFYGLQPRLNELRSIKRLLATLDVHFNLLSGPNAFEVNPVDLIAIEAIRVFHPKLYSDIRFNKNLFAAGLDARDVDQSKRELAQLNEFLRRNKISTESLTHSFLIALFPKIAALAGGVWSASNQDKWSADRRLCAESHFERYFILGVSDEELTESDADFLFKGQSADEVTKHLKMLASYGKLTDAIRKVRDRVRDVPRKSVPALLQGLLDSCDSLSPISREMFGIADLHAAEFAFDELVKRLKPESIESVLNEVLNRTTGLKLAVEYVRRLVYHSAENRLEHPIAIATLDRWKSLIVDRIRIWALDGSLWLLEGASTYLYIWAEWGLRPEVSHFIEESIRTYEGVLRFLEAFVLTAHSSSLNDEGGTEKRYIKLSDVERFIPLEKVEQALVRQGSEYQITTEQTRALKLFRDAQKRRARGVREDGPPSWMDEQEDYDEN